MGKTNTTEKRIETAAKIMGKALAKLAKADPEMARRMGAALAAAAESIR